MKAKVNYLGRRNFTKLYRDANFLSTLLTAGIVRTVSRLLSFLSLPSSIFSSLDFFSSKCNVYVQSTINGVSAFNYSCSFSTS